eukprot:scaffold29081_cov94-Isochrysis_galbana.AAC.1
MLAGLPAPLAQLGIALSQGRAAQGHHGPLLAGNLGLGPDRISRFPCSQIELERLQILRKPQVVLQAGPDHVGRVGRGSSTGRVWSGGHVPRRPAVRQQPHPQPTRVLPGLPRPALKPVSHPSRATRLGGAGSTGVGGRRGRGTPVPLYALWRGGGAAAASLGAA